MNRITACLQFLDFRGPSTDCRNHDILSVGPLAKSGEKERVVHNLLIFPHLPRTLNNLVIMPPGPQTGLGGSIFVFRDFYLQAPK